MDLQALLPEHFGTPEKWHRWSPALGSLWQGTGKGEGGMSGACLLLFQNHWEETGPSLFELGNSSLLPRAG